MFQNNLSSSYEKFFNEILQLGLLLLNWVIYSFLFNLVTILHWFLSNLTSVLLPVL